MDELYHTAQQLPLFSSGKVCIDCQKEKSLDAFQRGRNQCKECRIIPSRGYDRKRQQTEHRHQYDNARHRAKRAKQRAIREFEKLNAPPKTSKVCPKCDPPTEKPLSEFYKNRQTKDGHNVYCKECVKAYQHSSDRLKQRREQEQTRDEESKQAKYAARKAWRKRNIEGIRIRDREKYANNPEHAKRMGKHTKAWIAAHPMEMREHQMRRKARMLQSDPVNYTEILERDGAQCYICGQSINLTLSNKSGASLTFDHVIPLIPRPGDPQGTHIPDNIKPTHNACNGRKSNRPLETLTPFDRRGVQ